MPTFCTNAQAALASFFAIVEDEWKCVMSQPIKRIGAYSDESDQNVGLCIKCTPLELESLAIAEMLKKLRCKLNRHFGLCTGLVRLETRFLIVK